MNHLLKFLFLCFIFSLGFGASKFFGTNEEIKVEEPEIVVVKPSSSEYLELKETILKNYYKELDPAKKLEASDEIMEKLMLMFMANLGFKLTASEKSLVENPKSYDQYLKEVLTLCPALPKETGPEVYLNDGQDEKREKLIKDLKTCTETYGGLLKKPKLINDDQKEKFIGFEDNIFKKSGRGPEGFFSFDIFSDLWGSKPYSEKLEGLPKSFVKSYLGEMSGIYRTRSGEQGPIKIRLTEGSKSKEGAILINLSLSTKIGLYLDEVYKAEHPKNHSTNGKGPCRGMVLSKGKSRMIHLIKTPGKEGYFGRIYASGEVVSSFYVSKNFTKKSLNPSRWGKDQSFW
ncbi:MAG: hypothetical protein ACJAT2_000639 [Bacteriovoracaceae bacterium]|jgi:hypothetical protein